MAPKIRGVTPPSKRYKSNRGVKTPQKKISKSPHKNSKSPQKKAHHSAQRLQIGDIVDVRLEEPGLCGSWHPAVICGVKPGFRQVEFKNLLDKKNKPDKEWVRFGAEVPGPKQPLGTRKDSDGRPVLRLGGPGLPPAEPSFRKTGGWPRNLWVEVYAEEAWWEGVLEEDISASQMDEEDSVVNVIFPQLENLVEQVALKNLRECKVWNEVTGLWSIKGRLGSEDSPLRIKPPRTSVCEPNGGGATSGQEDSDLKILDGPGGEESLKSAADDEVPDDEVPSAAKQMSVVSDKIDLKKYFGRLIDVEARLGDRCYRLRVDSLQYTLPEIQIGIKHGFISLDVTSENTEMSIGSFVSKVHNICCALLEVPSAADVDYKNITYNITDEVLIFTLPWSSSGGKGGKELTPLSPRRHKFL